MPTNPRLSNKSPRNDVKPVEIDRWEGEGGNPPDTRRRDEPSATIAGILRRLLIDWHIINSPSSKQ